MTPARQAHSTIRRCVAADRIRLTQLFRVRLVERGVLWADVLSLVDSPVEMRGDGYDDQGRSRWILSGRAADGIEMGLVCVIGRDEAGELVVFVTAFWEDSQ